MKDDNDTIQQQILFDEENTPALNKEQELKVSTSPIFIDNQVFEKDNTPVLYEGDTAEKQSFSDTPDSEKSSKIWMLFWIVLIVLSSVELYHFFINGFINSPFSTSLYAFLMCCISLLIGKRLFKEFVSYRAYKKHKRLKLLAKHVFQGDSGVTAVELCEKIAANLPCDLRGEVDDVIKASPEYNEDEILALFSRNVLTQVDEKALAEVTKFASESTVLISLSPIAVLDMLLMLWRNLRMLDKIAGLYGLKLTYLSRIKLIKQAFRNMLYAGASELMLDFGSDVLSQELMGKLSTRMAQGLGAGMLTARLGLRAIHLCRPIPFEHPPKVSDLRKHIIAKLKNLLNKSTD